MIKFEGIFSFRLILNPVEEGQKWALGYVYGQACQVVPDTVPNKLYVSFNFTDPEPEAAFYDAKIDVPSNYNVYETDYENYTIGIEISPLFTIKKYDVFSYEL